MLENEVSGAAGGGTAAAEPGGVRKVEMAPAEPLDLLEVAGRPMLKRLVPLAAAFSLIALFVGRRRRGRGRLFRRRSRQRHT